MKLFRTYFHSKYHSFTGRLRFLLLIVVNYANYKIILPGFLINLICDLMSDFVSCISKYKTFTIIRL